VQSRPPTLADVARVVGVSASTASRALNGHRTGQQVAQQIRAAADRLGYTADPTARSVRTGATRTVATIVPDLARGHHGAFLRGVLDLADRAGATVTISAGTGPNGPSILRAIRAQRPTGVIVVASHLITAGPDADLADQIERLRHEGSRVLVIDSDHATGLDEGRAACALALRPRLTKELRR
jgi:LacI family transcriptional regulator